MTEEQIRIKEAESRAWCPDCRDELDCYAIWKRGSPGKVTISGHEYECFGCGKVFRLTVVRYV